MKSDYRTETVPKSVIKLLGLGHLLEKKKQIIRICSKRYIAEKTMEGNSVKVDILEP
jgi:hypothetical protein